MGTLRKLGWLTVGLMSIILAGCASNEPADSGSDAAVSEVTTATPVQVKEEAKPKPSIRGAKLVIPTESGNEILQGRFEQNYRAVIRRNAMFVLSEDGTCEVVVGGVDDCSFSRYQSLFISKQGDALHTDEETLRQLQQLGYVGGE